MYLQFYGLRERPFAATPDPRFLYPSPGHRDAMGQLLYGIRHGMGFMVLTGEVGTGKTTVLRAILRQLDPGTAVSYVFNCTLSFDGLLDYVAQDLGITSAGPSRAQRLLALNGFFLERHRAGQTTVLILDEAHTLSPAMLEHVRLLSNFETETSKLLQIVLAGQPELETKLQLPVLRQLRQRTALQCALSPLTREETHDYVRARLRSAGARDPGLFTEAALHEVTKQTRGIPRLINTLCEHCLIVGYADQKRSIGPDVVKEARDQMTAYRAARRHSPHAGAARPVRKWLRAALAAMGGGILAGCAAVGLMMR